MLAAKGVNDLNISVEDLCIKVNQHDRQIATLEATCSVRHGDKIMTIDNDSNSMIGVNGKLKLPSMKMIISVGLLIGSVIAGIIIALLAQKSLFSLLLSVISVLVY